VDGRSIISHRWNFLLQLLEYQSSKHVWAQHAGSAFMHGLCVEVDTELAGKLYHISTVFSRRLQCSANVLFLCRWDLALKLLQQMQAEGLRPSSGCLTSAINACLQGDQPGCNSWTRGSWHSLQQVKERACRVAPAPPMLSSLPLS
jgi:hypothetical protein